MQRDDCKSLITSNSIVIRRMDTKHVLSASNYHKDDGVVSTSRRLQNDQLTTIVCLTTIKAYGSKVITGFEYFQPRFAQ